MGCPPSPESGLADAPIALFAATPAGRLVAWNAAFAALIAPREAQSGEGLEALFGCPTGLVDWSAVRSEARREEIVCGSGAGDRGLELHLRRAGDGDDSTALVFGGVVDVTDRHRHARELRHAAEHDTLTGLPRPNAFRERLGQALAHVRRQPGYGCAVLLLDLDRFKVVNDSYGHAVGDLLIVAFTERVQGALKRSGDVLARLGGDELAVLLDDVATPQQAVRAAERIQALVRRPFDLGGVEIFTDASIGIAMASGETTPGELLRDADIALYRAKARGRGRAELFDQQMQEEAVAQSRLELDLRRALQRDEFELVYQPIVALGSAAVVSVEALVRWRRAGQGLLPPSAFLRLAEESGLMVRLGGWVLRAACRQAQAWRERGLAVRVAVNLSPLQFRQRELVNLVAGVLAETGVEPGALELEVNESAVLDDPDAGLRTITALRELGVRLTVDDFGTGCFSLAHLKRLPVHAVKIDERLVRDIPRDGGDSAIAKAVIDLGHSLGLQVIAEGVEREGQLSFLLAHGCDALQGYYFNQPVPWLDLERVLQPQAGGGPPRLPGHGAISVAALARSATQRDGAELAGLRVVVVEDEESSRTSVAALLELAGATVEAAGSAEEAIELIRRNPPDVLVSDIGLPGEDGYALVRRLRRLPVAEGGALPAVALTGHARSEDRVRALRAGFQSHTSKPIQPAELVAVVASVVGRDVSRPRSDISEEGAQRR
jgi:diguanylate cyclase (GGDEF)-like protein